MQPLDAHKNVLKPLENDDNPIKPPLLTRYTVCFNFLYIDRNYILISLSYFQNLFVNLKSSINFWQSHSEAAAFFFSYTNPKIHQFYMWAWFSQGDHWIYELFYEQIHFFHMNIWSNHLATLFTSNSWLSAINRIKG